MLTLLTYSCLFLAQPAVAPVPPTPFTAARFREYVAYLASDELEGRGVGSAGSAKAMAYLIRHFQDAGMKGLGKDGDWYQEFAYGPKSLIQARNVMAIFPGRGALADEAVIISAHHDHLGVNADLVKAGKDGIYNGADDNASGCAALVFAAQALAAERGLPASYRTVIFASFDAEEHGLVGSRHYVRHPSRWPGHSTTGTSKPLRCKALTRTAFTSLKER